MELSRSGLQLCNVMVICPFDLAQMGLSMDQKLVKSGTGGIFETDGLIFSVQSYME